MIRMPSNSKGKQSNGEITQKTGQTTNNKNKQTKVPFRNKQFQQYCTTIISKYSTGLDIITYCKI